MRNEKSALTFLEAAEMLEEAWKFGGDIHAEHGFLFALRYREVDLDAIEDAIKKLSLLPSAEEPINPEELIHFRRFVASAWPIPMYLGAKTEAGALDLRDPRQSAANQGLRREIVRILGRHSF